MQNERDQCNVSSTHRTRDDASHVHPVPDISKDLSWLDDALMSAGLPDDHEHAKTATEEQVVENRAHADESLSSVLVPREKFHAFSEEAQRVKRRHARLAQDRDCANILRDQALYHHDSANYKIRFVDESQSDLSRCLEALPDDAQLVRLRELCKQFFEDYAAFRSQIEQAQSLQQNLKTAELNMQKGEDLVLDSIDKLLNQVSDLGLPRSDDLQDTSGYLERSSEAIAEQPEVNKIHPSVADYYDKIGTIKVMRERASLLVEDYLEERGRRELLIDQGAILPLTYEEFEGGYRDRSIRAERDINEAVAAAASARAICDRDGVLGDIEEDLVRDDALAEQHVTPRVGFTDNVPPPSPLSLTALDPASLSVPKTGASVRIPSQPTTSTGAMESAVPVIKLSPKERQDNKARVLDWVQRIDPGAATTLSERRTSDGQDWIHVESPTVSSPPALDLVTETPAAPAHKASDDARSAKGYECDSSSRPTAGLTSSDEQNP